MHIHTFLCTYYMFIFEKLNNDMYLVQRKISNAMDVRRLIAEVYKRPALWDFQHEDYKGRHCVPKLWNEVAENVGTDVVQCKRKWKNLRDAYRAEVKRSERRIKRDKLMGVYEPKTKYKSKWVHFPALNFISDSNQNYGYPLENENTSSNSHDNNHYDETSNDIVYNENFNRVYNIKSEPNHNVDDDLNLVGDDDDTANDKLFEEFQNVATPQAARRLSATLSINNALEQHFTPQHVNDNPSASNAHKCQCPERSNDQVNFLEDLVKEERKLMKSTKEDITRSNKLDHIGDSDYNFLVSFLPQMKKLSELQNFKFRANMCETVLNILTPPITDTSVNPLYLTYNPDNDQKSLNMVHSISSNNLK